VYEKKRFHFASNFNPERSKRAIKHQQLRASSASSLAAKNKEDRKSFPG